MLTLLVRYVYAKTTDARLEIPFNDPHDNFNSQASLILTFECQTRVCMAIFNI